MIYSSADDLPFGLDKLGFLDNLALLAGALTITFLICCSIYYLVPKGHMPWRAIWPGALLVAAGAAVANALFPFYLVEIATINQVGGAIGFILIALVWFYLISLTILAGAVVNALRHELHDTGTLAEGFSGH